MAWNYETLDPASPVVSVVQQGGAGAGSPESGDRFGEVLDVFGSGEGPILMIGVPHEDVGTKVDAGAVALKMAEGPLSIVTQDSPGAGGVAEAGDRYGTSIDIYDAFTEDADDVVGVAIGVPGEDIGTMADAGAVAFALLRPGGYP